VAALARAGITFEAAIERILQSAAAVDHFRREPRSTDPAAIHALCAATSFFHDGEVAIAVELVEDRLVNGSGSDYCFFFADGADGVEGYACYGRVPLTQASWDLYWIVVDPRVQSRGLGSRLLRAVEREVVAHSTERQQLFADTAGRDQYAPTRAFYERNGYTTVARINDFYAPGDAKVVYGKRL
jgi:ribosomal protein S18 acetylase RimI-like enzyme